MPRVSQPSEALRVAWRAVWTSRLVVLLAGVFGVLSFGYPPGAARGYDQTGLTRPFGYFGNLLVSPLARWDSVWYLQVAQSGYGHGGQAARTTFFPLYPLMVRGLGVVVRSDLIAGVLISLVCFVVALVLLYRLVELELDAERARVCVTLIAFAPMAYYFSAVYTESLFLALSVGCVYAARTGRWAQAAVLGALASASRNTGFLLVVPIVLLYLYGPRTDRPPGHRRRWWIPAYRVEPSLAWVLLVPVGMGAYILFLALSTGHGLTPFTAEKLWYHHFAGPLGGVWDGTVAAWDGLRQLVHGSAHPVYFNLNGDPDPFKVAGQNLMLFGFLVVGALAFLGTLRRLPLAYGAYALVTLAVPLSYPVTPLPLSSLPRYELVVFPLFMWAADWVTRRHLSQVVPASAVLLGLFTVEFATWRFVA
jgi:Mannosyltransferase (PIG-V)